MTKSDKLGIIPAAGEGRRWGGFQKMFLPIGDGDWLIDRAIRALQYGGCNRIMVVTNPLSLTPLASHLKGKYKNLSFILNKRMDLDFYGSILATFPFSGDRNYFVMPDTYFSEGIFLDIPYDDLVIGTHKTKTPEKFGVLLNEFKGEREVVNKKTNLPKGTYTAWGCLVWTKLLADLWVEKQHLITNYTDAINYAIETAGVNTFDMGYYYDMGTFEDYRKLLESMDEEI